MHLIAVAADLMTSVIPDPHAAAPPGSGPILTVLNWISWICLVAGIAGFLISAGSLALAHHNGRPSESFKGMAYAIGSSILVGSVGGIMQIFQV